MTDLTSLLERAAKGLRAELEGGLLCGCEPKSLTQPGGRRCWAHVWLLEYEASTDHQSHGSQSQDSGAE